MKKRILILSTCLLSSCATPHKVDGLTHEQISQVIEKNQPLYLNCFAERVKAKPKLHGQVTVAFLIGPTGKVVDAKVGNSTTDDNSLDQCVVDVVKTAVFPPPNNNVEVKVTYPFTFKRAKN